MRTPFRACVVMSLLLASPPCVRAQAGGAASVQLSGRVSGVVAVSAPAGRTASGGARVTAAVVDAATVRVSISGSGDEEASVSLPLLLRSNVGYSLRASGLSGDEVAARLSVAGVSATGGFVHAGALEGVRAGQARDGARFPHLMLEGASPPVEILSGPAISKAGTFSSPDNALEVELSIRLRPKVAGKRWAMELTISAAPSR